MAFFSKTKKVPQEFKYSGKRVVTTTNEALFAGAGVMSDAVVSNLAMDNNVQVNLSGNAVIKLNPDSQLEALSITAGLATTGLRVDNISTTHNFSMLHASLVAAANKHLPYVVTIASQDKPIGSSHAYYHSVTDTGCGQMFAKNSQQLLDFNLIAHKISELSLTPMLVAQDANVMQSALLCLPTLELMQEFLGLPADVIAAPTAAQRLLYGATRRRIPELWDVDQPMLSGVEATQATYMQSVAGQRTYFLAHLPALMDTCLDEWYALTGRRYQRVEQYRCEDADYLIIAQGNVVEVAEVLADYMRDTKAIKLGVVNITVLRPFAGALISHLCQARKGITVLERVDQALAETLPLMREVRAAMTKAVENALSNSNESKNYAKYKQLNDFSSLYSVCFGLGKAGIQADDVLAAIENMLPTGAQTKFAYVGIDFVRKAGFNPQQEIQQQAVTDAYPDLRNLSLQATEIPNLAPENVLRMRMYAVNQAILTPNAQLVDTLIDLFPNELLTDYQTQATQHIYSVAIAPTALRVNCATAALDVVIVTDMSMFNLGNPIANLKPKGWLMLATKLATPELVWQNLPKVTQQQIQQHALQVLYINASEIIAGITQQVDAQIKFQTLVFQVAFFKQISELQVLATTEAEILLAIQASIKKSFPKQAEIAYQIAELGLQHMHVLDINALDITSVNAEIEPKLPALKLLKQINQPIPIADKQRFFVQNGADYLHNRGQNLADPFVAANVMPAISSVYQDLTPTRLEHPVWIAENCTACGDCYTACPDSAIPGLINSVNEVFETNIQRIEATGNAVKYLRRAIRVVEKKYHALTADKTEGTVLSPIFARAIGETIKEYPVSEQAAVSQEFALFKAAMGEFKFALTRPYHDEVNQRTPNNGGLFSITVNPMSCKGCMECVAVCNDDALKLMLQTSASIKTLRADWDYWQALPTSNSKYQRIDDLDAKTGALGTLLLDKANYFSMQGGDAAPAGVGEKTVVHLFTSTVNALMQPRVKAHVAHIDSLITGMEKYVRLTLAENLDISDIEAVEAAIETNKNLDLSLSKLSVALDVGKAAQTIDRVWLQWSANLIRELKQLKANYTQGRQALGLVNSSSSSSAAWTMPFNPYPFPWSSHLDMDAPSLALGIFTGHMLKMAAGFKTIRLAELALAGKYATASIDPTWQDFNWQQFTDMEYALCPPVVVLAGDETSWQDLASCLQAGKPIKILHLAAQKGAASFIQAAGQARKDTSLFAMTLGNTYTVQSSQAHINHLLAGYIDGLNYKGSALFSVHSVVQAEHGVALNSATMQSKLAVESRAQPLINFNPDNGESWDTCLSLQGNPSLDQDWSNYSLTYLDEYGLEESLTMPLTFADWAFTETRFAEHFTLLPIATNIDANMLELHKFIELDSFAMTGKKAFIYALDAKTQRLIHVIVAPAMIEATKARLQAWRRLQKMAGLKQAVVDISAITAQAKAEVAQSFAASLMNLVTDDAQALTDFIQSAPTVAVAPIITSTPTIVAASTPEKTVNSVANAATAATATNETVWIETPDCTTCDECVDINPKIFQYNADKKAVVIDPTAGTFEQIVQAAEKCTAVIIHPGTPWNPNEANLESLIQRAAKFQ